MLKFSDSSINKAIEIGRGHIDNFQLESEEGTKRTKAKYRALAISQRNEYVKKQMEDFSDLKLKIVDEVKERYNRLMPEDKTATLNDMRANYQNLYELVNYNSCMSDSFKLDIDYLLAKLSNDSSLEEFNAVIGEFINKFKDFGINLNLHDFRYTMFTEQYMETYFKNPSFEELREAFEKIYFKCPDIKLQMKMNFSFIISKYSNKLSSIVRKRVNNKYIQLNTNKENYMQKYIDTRKELGTFEAQDEYTNTKLFIDNKYKIEDLLDSSPTKFKDYELFIEGPFDGFDNIVKDRYNNALLDLYLTVNELKKYYIYEFIIKDLLERYKNKDNVKKDLEGKKKEIAKAEKERIKFNHKYLRASGRGLFAFKNESKKNDAMLKVNETVKNLSKLNDEYKDLTLTSNLNSLNESCTLYDLFLISLTSFTFLEKCFTGKEEFVGELSDIIGDYLRFLYNPMNAFIRKVNALVDYNISDIVTEKYKILDLMVNDTMLTSDGIDATIDSLKTINLIQNIDKSNISFDDIKILCDLNRIIEMNQDNSEEIKEEDSE